MAAPAASRPSRAPPAAMYAHVPDRDWESDANLSEAAVAGRGELVAGKSAAVAGRRRKNVEKPRQAGLEPAAQSAQSFWACMKLSKPDSVKRNHRFWSRRKVA